MARLLLALFLAAAVAAAGPEEKQKSKLAAVWVDYARWLKLQGHKTEAQDALARARAADAAAKGLGPLTAEVEALGDGKEPTAALASRRKKAHKDAAKVLDRLAKLGKEPRYGVYAAEAAALDPSKPRLGKLAAAARKAPTIIKSPDHPMVGWITLPKGWKKGKEFPVLVAVDGAGSNFLGACRGFSTHRGSRRFIVLAPCSFSNTNQLDAKKYPFYRPELLEDGNRDRIGFDVKGLDALLKQAKEWFGAADKIGITGFSGGGNLCYAWTVIHPDRVLFSAPACANFSGMGFNDAQRDPADGGPPIHIMTGEKDPHREWTHGKVNGVPGIEPQTDRAVQALEELGYKNFKRTMLKGVKHSSLPRQVWEYCDEVVGK